MQTATHEDFDRADQAKPSSDRTFGLVMAGALIFFGLVPRLRGRPFRIWCLEAAAIFLVAALVVPAVLHPLNVFWTKLGHLVGRVTNPIITGLLFFVVFAPLAFLMRLFGSDLLRLKLQPPGESYWIPRVPPGPPPSTLRNQF
jgi:hypothetical protein